ncbi:MAG: hypothetical protein J0L64_06135 [Acidobacteria bacterium]|nr:hypothetical protein [Acidobacteriota bacterium]
MRFPARLHVLLARDAPYAVILRRGPSNLVCTIGWDRANDTFQVGQWLRGRIYEERCDLSPDGRHLLYFALNGRWSSETKGSYTAVSRAPYLKAVSLYPQGDTWGGGGVFLDNRTFTTTGWPTALRECEELTRVHTSRWIGGPQAVRFERDGWLQVCTELPIYDRPASSGWLLRVRLCSGLPSTPGRGCHWAEYALVEAATGAVRFLPEWEWAGLDGARIVWTVAGTLNAARLTKRGLGPATLLADFNPLQYEPIQAQY